MYKAALAGAVLAAMGTTCTFAQNLRDGIL